MADVDGRGLVVMHDELFWRIEGPIFQPVPQYSYFRIAGESFYLADGVFSLAISPRHYDNSRYLFLRPLASRDLYFAKIEDIILSKNRIPPRFQYRRNILPSQASTMIFSSDGTLFFSLTTETATGCWNMFKSLIPRNIVS